MTYCTKKLKNIIFVLTILLAVGSFLGVASAGYDEVTVVVISGTISAPNCTISSGASSCSTTVTWSTSNATSPNVKQDGGSAFSTLASGSTSRTVNYGNSTFGVYNSTTLLNSATATASCTSGTSWNGSTCAAASITGSISAPNCTISSGASSCSTTVTWSTSNATSPNVKQDGGSAFSTLASGSTSRTVNYGNSTFGVYNSTTLLNSATATASCTSGTSWDGSKCAAAAASGTLTINGCTVSTGSSYCEQTCTIPLGEKYCNVTISWNTSGTTGSLLLYDGHVGWLGLGSPSGSMNRSYSAEFSRTGHYLYENGGGAMSTPHIYTYTRCASGTYYRRIYPDNVNACVPSGAFLYSAGCEIPENGSSCLVKIYFSAGSSYGFLWRNGSLLYEGFTQNEYEDPVAVNYSRNLNPTQSPVNLTLTDGWSNLATPVTSYVTCAPNTSWDGAKCSKNTYTVTSSAGANGTISASQTINHGSTAAFTVTPNTGYSIASVTGCGGTLSGNTYTTGAITAACTVSVSFSQLSYSLNYSAGTGGTISGTSSQSVNYGSNATAVTAVPNTGYHFTGWSEGGLHKFTSGSSTFTPPAGVSGVELLVVAGGGGGGSSSYGNGGGGGGGAGGLKYYSSYSVTPGSPISVSVGAGGISGELGAAQSGVNGGNSSFGSVITTGGGYGAGPGANGGSGGSGGGAGYNGYSSVRSGGSEISGEGYAGGSTTLLSWAGAAGGGGAGGVGQNNRTDHAGGPGGPGVTYSIEGTSKLYARGGGGGTSTSAFSVPNTGQGGDGSYGNEVYGPRGTPYTGASGVVVVKYPITTATRQDTSVTYNKNITASFEINTYTVSATAGAGGSISPTSASVTHGATTSFTITSNSGYHIDAVSGCGGTRSGNIYTTGAITANCTVSATFALDTFALSVSKNGTGSGVVTSSPAGINCGSTCSFVYDLGTSVTLTATPGIDGNIFAGWSGACSGTSTCTVSMTTARSVTATFNAITVSVTPTTTTYYTARSANNTFGFTPTTSTGTTECRLLNSSSTALTTYATGTSITYGMPATAGSYGYYIQCRNVAYPTKIATSSLVTVNVVTVGVTATTSYNKTPASSVAFTYTPTTTAGSTECALLNSSLTALTSYQAASPINYSIPNGIGSYGYYVRCRHTVVTSEIATSALITVTSACTTGTSWNGSACVTPTGTLTASNCSITAGNNTCQTLLNWNTSNPITTSAVTTNYPSAGSGPTPANSGTNVSYTIPYGPRTFYLYNNSSLLSQSTATASCAAGTVWNTQDGKCQATTGTINATGCTINAGSSSCSSTISWNTLNPVGTSIVKTSGGATVTSGNSGSVSYSVNPGSNTFNLWHDSKIIATATATVVCSSLAEWNGTICELKAPEILTFTASQSNSVRGRSVTLNWESDADATCSGTNFSTGGLPVGSVIVNPTVDTTYTLSCTRGTKTSTESIIVKMLDISINEQ